MPNAQATSTERDPADALLALDRQVCFALYSASLAMTKLYKPLLAPLGLTYPQYLAMLVLWEQERLSVGELGDRLALDSGTLTPLLKRLEQQGLVERERDPDDERRVLLHLTPAGRDLKIAARRVPPNILQATSCDLGQISSLTRQLAELRDSLSQATIDVVNRPPH